MERTNIYLKPRQTKALRRLAGLGCSGSWSRRSRGSPLADVARRVILVDTDILIARLRGRERAHAWLRRQVWPLLSILRAAPVTELIGRRAGELMRSYRRSHRGIGIADYLVAATAEQHGAELATLNVRHFPMFPDLEPPFPLASL